MGKFARLDIRLTDEEKKRLKAMAQEAGLTVSEFVRSRLGLSKEQKPQ